MNRVLTGADAELLARVRETVRAVEPDARVILYGSRARGDAGPESDWDFLILLDGPVTRERELPVRHALYTLELECGEVLSSIFISSEDWRTPGYRVMPYHENVTREGIDL